MLYPTTFYTYVLLSAFLLNKGNIFTHKILPPFHYNLLICFLHTYQRVFSFARIFSYTFPKILIFLLYSSIQLKQDLIWLYFMLFIESYIKNYRNNSHGTLEVSMCVCGTQSELFSSKIPLYFQVSTYRDQFNIFR